MCMNGDAATKLPEGMATCLCNVAFELQPEMKWLPEWRYKQATREFMLMCPNCNFHTFAFDNKNAAIACWSISNRSGDEHILMMWKRDYARQKDQAVNKAA